MTHIFAKKVKTSQGYRMEFYKDQDCKVFVAADPYHTIRKNQPVTINGFKYMAIVNF
jgi:hypothetical protein